VQGISVVSIVLGDVEAMRVKKVYRDKATVGREARPEFFEELLATQNIDPQIEELNFRPG
jgi:hypothetical protein